MGIMIRISDGIGFVALGPIISYAHLQSEFFANALPFISESDTGHYCFEVYNGSSMIISFTVARLVSMGELFDAFKFLASGYSEPH